MYSRSNRNVLERERERERHTDRQKGRERERAVPLQTDNSKDLRRGRAMRERERERMTETETETQRETCHFRHRLQSGDLRQCSTSSLRARDRDRDTEGGSLGHRINVQFRATHHYFTQEKLRRGGNFTVYDAVTRIPITGCDWFIQLSNRSYPARKHRLK